jgi:glycosyltransferase involved in cell wall biosynthesis
LWEALLAHGMDAHLIAGKSDDCFAVCDVLNDHTRAHLIAQSQFARQWRLAKRFRMEAAGLFQSSETKIIVHDHGVWLPTNHAISAFVRSNRLPLVVSPHGMLSPWAMQYGRLKKRLAWLTYQRRDLTFATSFHAASQVEAAEIRALGFVQPIAVIPIGIEFPPERHSKSPARECRTMLFLSRIHPKKGLENLIRAWKKANVDRRWRLVIAGPDEEGHRKFIERLAIESGIQSQLSFPGRIADADKWRWYADADIFILPSFSENFGLVVAEALAAGTPVITTTGTPWSELPKMRIGWQAEPTCDALANVIREATNMSPADLAAMGERGAMWVRQRFSWRDSAQQMIGLYHWLLYPTTARPSYVWI